jgi:hypothetical protein
MIIDSGNETKPALRLAFPDLAWVAVFVVANVVPLLFWSAIDGWARQSLLLYAGR